MLNNVGMAVPKTTETRCRDGSVFFIPDIILRANFAGSLKQKEMQGWGYLCSFCITCLACTLPSIHLVSVVFGTAIPTSFNIKKKLSILVCFHFSCTIVH